MRPVRRIVTGTCNLTLNAGGPELIRAGHRSANGGLVSLDGRVRLPDPLLWIVAEHANRQSDEVEIS